MSSSGEFWRIWRWEVKIVKCLGHPDGADTALALGLGGLWQFLSGIKQSAGPRSESGLISSVFWTVFASSEHPGSHRDGETQLLDCNKFALANYIPIPESLTNISHNLTLHVCKNDWLWKFKWKLESNLYRYEILFALEFRSDYFANYIPAGHIWHCTRQSDRCNSAPLTRVTLSWHAWHSDTS